MNVADGSTAHLRRISLCVGVFTLAAFAGALAAKTLTKEGGPEKAQVSKQVAAPVPAQATHGSWLASAWRSREEIEAHVASLSAARIRSLLQELEGDFWRGHPNASETLRSALLKLTEQTPPLVVLTEIAAWLDTRQLPEPSRRRLWRDAVAVISTEVELDITALASLVRGRSEEHIFATLEAILKARPAASPEAELRRALDFLASVDLKEQGPVKSKAEAMVGTAWLIRAPEETLRMAAAGTDGMESLEVPLRKMRRLDPEGAVRILRLASALGVGSGSLGQSAFMAGFTAEEIRTAVAETPVEKRRRSLHAYALRAHEFAPDQLLAFAATFPAEDFFETKAEGTRSAGRGAFALVAALAAGDPEACKQWLAPLAKEIRKMALEGVMKSPRLPSAQFARFYLREFEEQTGEPPPRDVLQNAIATIGKDDPGEARSLLHHLSEAEWMETDKLLRRREMAHVSSETPEAAIAMTASATEPVRKELLEIFVLQQEIMKPGGDADWLKAVQDPELHRHLELRWEILQGGDVGPDVSAEARRKKLVSLGASQQQANQGIAYVVEAAARRHPQTAGDMVIQIQDAELRAEILSEFTSSWATHDPAGAAAWAATLPAGSDLDRVAAEVIAVLPDQPNDALAWASAIADPQIRFETVEGLITTWAAADVQVAERLAGIAPATAEEKAKLRAIIAGAPQARRDGGGL